MNFFFFLPLCFVLRQHFHFVVCVCSITLSVFHVRLTYCFCFFMKVVDLLLTDPRVDPASKLNYPIRGAADAGHVNVVKRLLQVPLILAYLHLQRRLFFL